MGRVGEFLEDDLVGQRDADVRLVQPRIGEVDRLPDDDAGLADGGSELAAQGEFERAGFE